MKKSSLVGAAVLAALMVTVNAPALAAQSEKALSTTELQRMVQRERDAREVANVMAKRAAWYVMGRGDLYVELFARKQPDVSFSMNGNHILVGYDKVKAAFGKDNSAKAGDVRVHALLSPIIEVAEDGQTAKGFWQTSGPGFQVASGNPAAQIAWENYAVDFIKEDGQWKIWHLHNITHYYYDLDKTFAEQVAAASAPPAQGGMGAGGPPPGGAASGPIYRAWTPTTTPNQIPLPQPYRTFSETFSYGPAAVQ